MISGEHLAVAACVGLVVLTLLAAGSATSSAADYVSEFDYILDEHEVAKPKSSTVDPVIHTDSESGWPQQTEENQDD